MVGVALAGGMTVASADVSVFGHLDAAITNFDSGGAGPGSDDTNFQCTTCSIGFKGSEDLGNGLKAIFKLDFQFDMMNRNRVTSTSVSVTPGGVLVTTGGTATTSVSQGSGAITDRDQWVGLAGGFGKVRVGTISTGYKSHGAMIDPLYRTALQGRDRGLQSTYHRGAGEELQGRATNTVRWDSADYNGVKLVAHYTLDSDETNGEDDNPYGVGASYSNKSMLVFADYMDNAQGGTAERDAWKVGGKYDLGMFSFMGQYEDYSNSSTDDETAWHIAGAVNGLLGINIYLGFGMGEDDTSGDELTSWTLAVSHDFSKRTMLYAGHSQYDCDTGGPGATLSICSSVGASGGEDDRTAIGLKHKF